MIAIICYRTQLPKSEPLTNEDVLDKLESTPLDQLSAYVDSELGTTLDIKSIVEQKRAHGIRKVGAALQDFTLTFNDFLKAYAGVVEVVKAADAQYGNVAFAALSLLFVVRVLRLSGVDKN